MKRLPFLGVALVVMGVVFGLLDRSLAGQQAQVPAAGAAREVPPERKALNEANKIADPDKKIEALRKVVEDFPKSPVAGSANFAIFTTLVAKMKDAGSRAIDQAKLIAEIDTGTSRGSQHTQLAGVLLAQGVLLEEAEAFARKGVDSLDEKRFVEGRKQSLAQAAAEARERDPESAPVAPPDEAQLARMFRAAKQNAYSTLGQISAKLGKHAEAEKALREAYAIDAKGSAAAAAALRLADYSKKAGRDAEQLEYLAAVALAGRLTADAKADLEAVYKRTHGGSLDGLEEMLDRRYEAENPMPVPVTPYARPAGRTDRVVLAEIFTGAGCGPCVGADLAFEAALERYGLRDLAVLMYHLHIPRPDPMTNPSTQERQKRYEIRGVPSFYIDGESDGRGGGDAASAPGIYRGRVEPAIEKRLVAKPGAKIGLSAAHAIVAAAGPRPVAPAIRVNAAVSGVKSASANLKLQIMLVEERVRYSGENGVRFHPMVVRAVAGVHGSQGFPLTAGKNLEVEYTFDIDRVMAEAREHLDDFEKTSTRFPNHKFLEKKHGVEATRLSVVAFVQDEGDRTVLQAAVAKPASAPRGH